MVTKMATLRRRRIRRVLKWGGLLLSGFVAVAWMWSHIDTSIHDFGSYPVGYGTDGMVHAFRTLQLAQGDCLFQYYFYPPGSMTVFSDPFERSWIGIDEDHIWLDFPLWKLFLLVVVPTAFLWWLDRGRVPAGHCRVCDYDLTGNVSGVCPECGSKVPIRVADASGAVPPQATSNAKDDRQRYPGE
jgi:hypothetical protein